MSAVLYLFVVKLLRLHFILSIQSTSLAVVVKITVHYARI